MLQNNANMKEKGKHFSIKGSLFRFIRITLKQTATPFVLFRARSVRKHNLIESERRRKLSIFDTHELSSRLPYAAYHITHGMNIYSFFYSFTQYAGIKKINSRYGIEHGLYFAAKGKKNSYEITFSDYREPALMKAYSKAIKIGPYIHYAEPLLDDMAFTQLKQYLGKVLLVFPIHSLDSFQATYDIQTFIDFVELHKTGYDTVMVCLHWKDFELNRDAVYKKQGYKVVTAGHPYDIYFLPRLKSIIGLSNMVVSNDIGTHLGYCIYMNKPVSIFFQPIEFKPGDSEKAFKKEINIRNPNERKELHQIKERLSHLFGIFEEKITPEQYDEISYLFGFDYIRDKEMLGKLLK